MTDENPKSQIASRNSWQIQPMPDKRSRLSFERLFTSDEVQQISKGLIPMAMEDKWFIFCEDDWLYFHRSWTGACIYQVKIVPNREKYVVAEAWVNRSFKQYKSFSKSYDALLLGFLIDNFLLGKATPFPMPKYLSKILPKGAFQHSISGSAYTEVETGKKDKS
jgi:hypothetical protein